MYDLGQHKQDCSRTGLMFWTSTFASGPAVMENPVTVVHFCIKFE